MEGFGGKISGLDVLAWPGVGSLQLSNIVIHILHIWLSWEGFSGVLGAPI